MTYTFTGAFQAPFLGVYLTLGVQGDVRWYPVLSR